MRLMVMRHGEAGVAPRDSLRELTEAGRQATATIAGGMAGGGWLPDLIWCSPLVRARQTAALVAEILRCPVEEKGFITPDDDPGVCLEHLLAGAPDNLMLVSHMPFVGVLVSLLTESHRRGIPFMTSEAMLLEMPIAGPGCASVTARFPS